jgi:hypothetical protein
VACWKWITEGDALPTDAMDLLDSEVGYDCLTHIEFVIDGVNVSIQKPSEGQRDGHEERFFYSGNKGLSLKSNVVITGG